MSQEFEQHRCLVTCIDHKEVESESHQIFQQSNVFHLASVLIYRLTDVFQTNYDLDLDRAVSDHSSIDHTLDSTDVFNC